MILIKPQQNARYACALNNRKEPGPARISEHIVRGSLTTGGMKSGILQRLVLKEPLVGGNSYGKVVGNGVTLVLHSGYSLEIVLRVRSKQSIMFSLLGQVACS